MFYLYIPKDITRRNNEISILQKLNKCCYYLYFHDKKMKHSRIIIMIIPMQKYGIDQWDEYVKKYVFLFQIMSL
jgi:hypothetical protein